MEIIAKKFKKMPEDLYILKKYTTFASRIYYICLIVHL